MIKIDGEEQKDLKNAVISLDIDENLESASMSNISINEGFDIKTRQFLWLDNKLISPEEGKDIEIFIDYAHNPKKFSEPLIKGKISALNPSFPSTGIPNLNIQVYDHSFCLQKAVSKQKRAFDNERDHGDVVKKIASEHNIGIGRVDDSKIKPCEKITQNPEENDYNFLKRLADRLGYEFFIRDKKIYFKKPDDDKKEIIALKWGKELMSFSPRLSTAKIVGQITVMGHNTRDPSKPIRGVATLKDVGITEPKTKSGAESAKDCLKKDIETSEHDFTVCDEADANALAKSLLIKANNSLVEGYCESIGIPQIRPGINVLIEGVGKRFSGKYYVKSVKHTIGDGGYTLSFEVRRGLIGTV